MAIEWVLYERDTAIRRRQFWTVTMNIEQDWDDPPQISERVV
jgi:hypothetical protein